MLGPIQKTFASELDSNEFQRKGLCNFIALRSWYDEMKQYTWNIEPKGSFKAGQFSQMVWKNSKELGVGLGRTKTGKVVVVASELNVDPKKTTIIETRIFLAYYPRGNIIGQFLQNVKRSN